MSLNLPDPPAWMAEALCSQVDAELWFPPVHGSARKARAICAACPVAAPCLAGAIERREIHGVWAGTTIIQRRRMWRAA